MDKPTDKQIEEMIVEASMEAMSDDPKFPGLSYADGVEAALRWVQGDPDYPSPFED